ncbi:MAG: cytochrome C oxidase subunit III [Helicobacteraceae bacterium]|nr:cytochrome C oxidase subunit III [Helicobacteraceae bacterium]
MNKLVLWGIIITAAMLGFTYLAVGLTKGGLGGDIVNQLAVAGAVVLVLVTVYVVIGYVRQMQEETASGTLADETWDGIGEYKNELPMGWAIIFLGSTIWAIWYFLVGYPVNAYSQIGEYNEAVTEHNSKYEAKFENIKNDPEQLNAMGESVFIANCKVCHGLEADGIGGKAADLNHRLDAKAVEFAINNGSSKLGGYPMGVMPAGMAQGKDVTEIADFVAGGMTSNKGRAAYEMACASCHGSDGSGMGGMAPNIKVFTPMLIGKVLDHGKKGGIGIMPSFEHSLNATQKLAVETYIVNISKGAN